MSYDNYISRVPDTDECSEDAETCPCPECESWRNNREPSEVSFDEALGAVCGERERQAEAQRLKR